MPNIIATYKKHLLDVLNKKMIYILIISCDDKSSEIRNCHS